MAVTGKPLVAEQQIAAAVTTYYTAASVRARIDKCTVTNTTAGAVTFNLYRITLSATAGYANQVIDTKSVGVDETYTCPEIVGHWLSPGDFLAANASAGASLTLMISGIEVT